MRRVLPVLILAAGVVLLILGIDSSGALETGFGGIFDRTPDARSLVLLILGVLLLLYGGVGALFSRK